MAFMEKIDRKEIHFTNHALDRFWERCEANDIHGRNASLDLLRTRLQGKRIEKEIPEWTKCNLFHRASAEGFIRLSDDEGFVVKKNPNGDRVAVTFLDRLPTDHT